MRMFLFPSLVTTLALCAAGLLSRAAPSLRADPPPGPPSPGQAAFAAAAQNNQYLFVQFWRENDDATQAVRQTLTAALAKQGSRATWTAVRVNDATEKPLVDLYGVSRSPMPLVVAVAPNGAVTGGFALKLTEKDVAGALVSPAQAACLKAVQARKLALLCVLPAGSTGLLPEGVREFKADARFGPASEVVTVRADDTAEAGLLQGLQVSPSTAVPVTALLVPPGRLLGTFPGTVTKQQLVERITSPQGCCPGGKCGPGGCCGQK